MTRLLLLLLGCGLFSVAQAQEGCTNIWAINFDPSAIVDDGTCEIFTAELEFDATLDDPITIGTGISNEHATIANYGPVQMGLKVNERFVDDIIPVGSDYFTTTGFSRTSFFDETPVPGVAKWDLIFSVNLGDYTFEELQVIVEMDFDPTEDNTLATPYNFELSNVLQGIGLGGSSLRQQSENLGFAFWGALAGPDAALFDPLQEGVYDFSLVLKNAGDQELARSSMRVLVGDAVEGCTNAEACNYNPEANLDDASCVFANPNEDCLGNCIHDFNNNGVCDEEEVYGCTYSEAINFDPAATADDGSCVQGGDSCEGDFDGDNAVGVSDLLVFLTLYGNSCVN
jgi:hypothetical protein